MGVFKRGSVYWISYSVGGKQFRESAGTADKGLALQALLKRKTEIFEGKFFPDKRRAVITVSELRDMWLEASAHKRSLRSDRQRFAAVVERLGAATPINCITSEDIEELKAKLKLTKTFYGRPMSDATVNRHLALLRSAFRLAALRGCQHRNPMAGVRLIPERNERSRICTDSEYKALLGCADQQLRLAIVIAYWTAMRQAEIANLEWSNVDLVNGVIQLDACETKTSSAREIPLATEVVTALRSTPRRIDGRLLAYSAPRLSQAFRRQCRALGIKGLRFHDLRHTAITNLRRAGVDLLTIRAISGHKTLQVLARYNTIDLRDMLEAVAKLERNRKNSTSVRNYSDGEPQNQNGMAADTSITS